MILQYTKDPTKDPTYEIILKKSYKVSRIRGELKTDSLNQEQVCFDYR